MEATYSSKTLTDFQQIMQHLSQTRDSSAVEPVSEA
jgi:hypothetical protein